MFFCLPSLPCVTSVLLCPLKVQTVPPWCERHHIWHGGLQLLRHIKGSLLQPRPTEALHANVLVGKVRTIHVHTTTIVHFYEAFTLTSYLFFYVAFSYDCSLLLYASATCNDTCQKSENAILLNICMCLKTVQWPGCNLKLKMVLY